MLCNQKNNWLCYIFDLFWYHLHYIHFFTYTKHKSTEISCNDRKLTNEICFISNGFTLSLHYDHCPPLEIDSSRIYRHIRCKCPRLLNQIFLGHELIKYYILCSLLLPALSNFVIQPDYRVIIFNQRLSISIKQIL